MKFNKKEIKFYEDNFKKLMSLVNAKQSNLDNSEYIIKSEYGDFSIFMDDLDYKNNCGILAIHTCFEDVEKAKRKFECNKWTGKYNFYDRDISSGLRILYIILFQVTKGNIKGFNIPKLETNKFTKAKVYYKNCGESKEIECTNGNLTRTLNKLKKCEWITDIEVKKFTC